MIRRSSVAASIAAAALLLAACGNGDEGGVQELDLPEDNGQTGTDQQPADDGSDGQDPGDTNGDDQDLDEPAGDGQDANGSDEDSGAFDVPDEIDVDYVQSVFDEITRVDGDHLVSILEREVPSAIEAEDYATMDALYGGPLESERFDLVSDLLFDPESRETYLDVDDLGGHRFEVKELHAASDSCVAALGWWDLTEISTEPFPEDLNAAWVLARDESVDPEINPTGWVNWDRTPLVDAENNQPVPPDDWDDLDFGAGTDVDCAQGD